MATMRPLRRRIELNWIVLWLAGALCGALVMVGVNSVVQPGQRTTAPLVVVTTSGDASAPLGGRLGGITSADTATDWLIRQGLAVSAASSELQRADEPFVVGGRLGGLESSDTPTDAAVKERLQRIVGPGEGLNQVP